MGMDLTRRRDSKKWSCNNALWRFIIDAAKQSGWIPLGTKIKSEDYVTHDNQDYFSNNGQMVTPEDTQSLCENLEKYLNEFKPQEIEKEIIESFLDWACRKDTNNNLIDIPGFVIR